MSLFQLLVNSSKESKFVAALLISIADQTAVKSAGASQSSISIVPPTHPMHSEIETPSPKVEVGVEVEPLTPVSNDGSIQKEEQTDKDEAIEPTVESQSIDEPQADE